MIRIGRENVAEASKARQATDGDVHMRDDNRATGDWRDFPVEFGCELIAFIVVFFGICAVIALSWPR